MASSEMAKSDGEQDPSPGENILVWESADIAIVIKGTLVLPVCEDCFWGEEEVEQLDLREKKEEILNEGNRLLDEGTKQNVRRITI